MRVESSQARRAFTLVELLVVIGIIAVLISLLMPGYSKARQAANRVVCESNMRQIGQAMMIYADASDGYLFPNTMGADLSHITDFPPQVPILTAPGAPGQINSLGHMVYYVTWPGVVLGGLTTTPPSLPATPSATVDQTLLNFTKAATSPLMFCPSDDPSPYAYHSYIVNSHVAYYNVKFSSKLPNGQSSGNVILMGEKTTTQCDYYMEYGDFAAGKVALNRHPIGVAVNPLFGTLVNDPSMPGRMVALGSNYLFLDLHVDNLLSAPSAGALDPWDFTNGQTPPGYTPPPAQ